MKKEKISPGKQARGKFSFFSVENVSKAFCNLMAFHFKAKLFPSFRHSIWFPPTGKAPQQVQVVEYTEKSQDKHESRHVQLVREYGFHPRSKVQVVDGALLPRKFEPFPEDMYGRPLEEIDSFIYEEVST